MTMQKQDILDGFYEGNSKKILVEIKEEGVLKSLPGSQITYVIMDRTDYDIVHLMKRSYVDGEGITIVGEGLCQIEFFPSDTIDLHGTFRHHLNVVDNIGKQATVFTGLIMVHETSGNRYLETGKPAYLEATI